MASEPGTLTPQLTPMAVQMLGPCPRCSESVVADADAVRYDQHWYHVRCALEQQSARES